ncbi:asparaginase [Erythrobacter mangrovi]|uniref:Asparaginase n=1 Tax=Erythrobacter mangrovi TaxID=2739433 RepID=A0A7D4ASD7_9SPHN|nr:asparaginase [Erythrobacter mangrovi]QKG70077.1 asparaginase [Erythrobacter mangrovi]
MTTAKIRVLATGGTIAGSAGSALQRGYAPGQIGIDAMMASVAELGLDAELDGIDIAAVGSQDIGWRDWQALHREIAAATSDDGISGIIVTHGTDTAEETALLLDLTHPATKPVVLVGAMRPADAVGSDGMRNFANAVRVAGDHMAAGRGVLVVMGDSIFAAIDVRKAATSSIDAFRGFPRGALGMVTPLTLDWFGPPDRPGAAARFAWPDALPHVEVVYAHAGMDAGLVEGALSRGARGIVLAGMGQGNAPTTVLDALEAAVKRGALVVRASRVDEGSVDRNLEVDDDARGFVASRSHNPQKARILAQLLVASGITDPLAAQAHFDRR